MGEVVLVDGDASLWAEDPAYPPEYASDAMFEFEGGAYSGMEMAGAHGGVVVAPSHGVPSGGSCPHGAESYMNRAQEAGMPIDEQALRALLTLPVDHAMDLLEGTIEKRHSVRNASSYITSTIQRGFVPRSPASIAGTAVKGGSKGVRREPSGQELSNVGRKVTLDDLAAAGVSNTVRLHQANIELTEEALRALSTLAPTHSAELIDFVCDSSPGTLRDPSNYIASTVSHGFTSRRTGDVYESRERHAPVADHGRRPFADHGGRPFVDHGGKGAFAAAPAAAPLALPSHMIPKDATSLEMRVLNLNALNLWDGQQVDFPSFLALRSLDDHTALDVLDGMEHKSRVSGISKPCNYVQATVNKIVKGHGKCGSGKDGKDGKAPFLHPVGSGKGFGKGKGGKDDGGRNPTGNLSGQRAAEIGLTLTDQAHHILANMGLRNAYELLDCAAEIAQNGTNPSDYIISCTSQTSDQPLKRPRIIPVFADERPPG